MEPPKIPYISGKVTFLHYRKQKPQKNSLYFRKQSFLNISGRTSKAPKTKLSDISPKRL